MEKRLFSFGVLYWKLSKEQKMGEAWERGYMHEVPLETCLHTTPLHWNYGQFQFSCWIAIIQVTLHVRHIQAVLKPKVTAPLWYQSASSCSRWPANFKRTNCMCHNIQMVGSCTEELTKPLSYQKIWRGLVQGLGLAWGNMVLCKPLLSQLESWSSDYE